MDVLKEIFYWVATFTDAYFQTDLPQETWNAFCDTIVEWTDVIADTLIFIINFIASVQGGINIV